MEYEQTEEKRLETTPKLKKEGEFKTQETDEIQFGVRGLLTNPLSACEKIDKIFGSGGEAIVHHMWFESGHDLFDKMIKSNPNKSAQELLKALIDMQPRTGWGIVSIRTLHASPPIVDVVVKNPAVKTLKGSQKHMIGSFWAGIFSRYFNRQLVCRNFSYDTDRDEFTCTITT